MLPTAVFLAPQLRDNDVADGKMGEEQRLELEEAMRLEKWIENVPMMTIEGQACPCPRREADRADGHSSCSSSRCAILTFLFNRPSQP